MTKVKSEEEKMIVRTVLASSAVIAALGLSTGAHADSISGEINAEWFFPAPIFAVFSLPEVQSIDSVTIELAHGNGNGLFLYYMDAAEVVGELDFEFMVEETAGGIPSFSMGLAPGDTTLANVAAYTFVPPGTGGQIDFTAPHTFSGTFDANFWTTGPLAAQEYALIIGDTSFFKGGAAGSWTVNYTPIPGPGVLGAFALAGLVRRRRRW